MLSYKTKLKRGIFNVCFPHYFFVILLPISADKKFQENVGNNLKKVYFLSNFITGKGFIDKMEISVSIDIDVCLINVIKFDIMLSTSKT